MYYNHVVRSSVMVFLLRYLALAFMSCLDACYSLNLCRWCTLKQR